MRKQLRKKYPNVFMCNEVKNSNEEEIKIEDDDFTQVISDVTISTSDDKEEKGMTMHKNVRDMFGNMIVVGNYISYPCRKEGDTYMRTAKVLGIVERSLPDKEPEMVLKVAVAIAPRWEERKSDPNWQSRISKTVVSQFYRSVVIPQSYIQNDKRYKKLLEV